MTDIQAALGIHQLQRLDGFIEKRQHYAQLYDAGFADIQQVSVPITHSDRNHVYHLYVIRINQDSLGIDRAKLIDELRSRNIGSSVHFIPVHLHPFYRERYGYKRGDLPRAEAIYDSIVSLPLYPRMSMEDIEYVIQSVDAIVKHKRK
jgi:dTDP-4-amino-4,6-dideoxygalactose transaminase